ncbi:hypothetical protein [Rickettsia endosymbiont of Halotydeus destructor]|uniref:hypothetical protein n=1 Tax=Rickettsia endosymbiont of Halotydeus destructor TaxID=2996754 RepID=UPI003BAFE0C1
MSKEDNYTTPEEKKANQVLISEKKNLEQILNNIDNLIENNKQLEDFREVQKQITELKKEQNLSIPWFKKLIKIISNVKYVVVKSESQLTEEAIKNINKTLQSVDNNLHLIAEKSAPLKETMKKEIRKNLEGLSGKNLSKEQQDKLENLELNPLLLTKLSENNNIENALFNIKNNILTLLDENKNITELTQIKQQIKEIKSETPLTFFEKLSKSFQKIKSIFVDTPEQVFQGSKQKTIEKLGHIEKALDSIDKNIKNLSQDIRSKTLIKADNISPNKLPEAINKLSPTVFVVPENLHDNLLPSLNDDLNQDTPFPPPPIKNEGFSTFKERAGAPTIPYPLAKSIDTNPVIKRAQALSSTESASSNNFAGVKRNRGQKMSNKLPTH